VFLAYRVKCQPPSTPEIRLLVFRQAFRAVLQAVTPVETMVDAYRHDPGSIAVRVVFLVNKTLVCPESRLERPLIRGASLFRQNLNDFIVSRFINIPVPNRFIGPC